MFLLTDNEENNKCQFQSIYLNSKLNQTCANSVKIEIGTLTNQKGLIQKNEFKAIF